MFVQSFFVPGLAHLSYLLGGKSACAIVDPQRNVEEYLSAAKGMGMRITHILETHLHADFVSGHMDLAAKTGAEIVAPRAGGCRFPHRAVAEGDEIQIEDMAIRVLDTPGHTPEHITYVVTDASRGKEPAAVFCGDTLFVGDVGRPDLFPGQAAELAGKLHDSLGKIKALPDPTLVLPAHGAGSLCGRAMGAMRFSAVGYEKRFNRELQHATLDAFRASLLSGMPEAPDHFARCSDINRKGPAKIGDLPAPRPMSAAEVEAQARKGAVIPPEKPIVLILDSESRAPEAAAMLRRVGLDGVSGWLDGGMHSWNVAGLAEEHVPQIAAQDLAAILAKDDKSVVLDVRGKLEFETLHLNGAINIAAPDVRRRHPEIPRDRPVYVICNSGHRSSLACSILQQQGFKNATNVVGGMMAFSAAGLVGTCPICVAPHLPSAQGAQGSK